MKLPGKKVPGVSRDGAALAPPPSGDASGNPPIPATIRGPGLVFAVLFFLVSAVFYLVWWDQFPIIIDLLQAYWKRDSRFLVPAWPGFAFTWYRNTVSMVFLLAAEAGALFLGRRILEWAHARFAFGSEPDALWKFLFSLGLGNGLLGTGTLALGLSGLAYPSVFRVLLFVALAGAAFMREWRTLPGIFAPVADPPAEPAGEPDASKAGVWRASLAPGAGVAKALERGVWLVAALVAVACLAGLVMVYVSLVREGTTTVTLSLVFCGVGLLATVGWSLADHWGSAEAAASRIRWVNRLLIIFCVFIAVTNWLPAFEPEWFYDSLVYHVAVPEQYLLAHKIGYLGSTFFSNFPFLQEMRYMFLLGLGDDVACKLLHWADGCLAAVAVFALGRSLAGSTAGWLAAAVFLSQPTLRFLGHITMVELGMTWYQILAVMAFVAGMKWVKTSDASRGSSAADAGAGGEHGQPSWPRPPNASLAGAGGWLLLTGWFLGYAQGTKYIGIYASGLILAWLCLMHFRSGRPGRQPGWRPGPAELAKRQPRQLRCRCWRPLAGKLALIVGVASAWTGTWLVKNWLLTGDPFFPLLQNIFPAINWDQALYSRWMIDNTKYGTGHGSLVKWLTMPTYASIDMANFGTFTLNPAVMLFLPWLFFHRRLPGAVKFLAWYSTGYFVVWALSSQQTRFIYPMVAPAAVAVAFVVTRMGRESMAARGVLAVSVTWLLIVSLFGQIHNRYSNNALTPFTFGQLDRDGLLRVGVNYYETVEEANRVVPPGSRIVFLGGDESFYLARGRICNSIYDRSELGRLADQAADARDMLDQLGRRRITHLIVNEPRCEEYASAGYGMFEWSEKAKKVFLDMWATYGRLVFVSHGVFLFELSSRPIPTAERKTGYPSYFHPPEVVQKSRDTVAAIDRAVGKGDNEDTYRLAEELVRMVPGMAHAWAYRGYANSSLHRRKAAIADYQRAIKVGYPTGVVYHNLALLLEEEKRYPEALISYLGAIRLEGNIGRALPRAADIALGLGRIPLALQLAERAFEANPADPEAKTRVEKIRQLAGVRGR